MPEAVLIYNPLAGSANGTTALRQVASFWQEHGWHVTIQQTTHTGHATALAEEAVRSGYRLVMAAGGDGTLGEIASGLADSGVVMAPLPMGTGNSFAKELGMVPRLGFHGPDRLLDISRSLLAGRVQRMDVGCCAGHRHWLLWASAGVDGFLIDQIEPRSKLSKKLGPLGYLGEGLPVIPRFHGMHATVEIDGRSFSGEYLMVTISNCRLYAGGELLLNPNAVLDDGLFEVWLFGGKDTRTIFNYLVQVALGRHARHPDVHTVTGRQVTVQTEPPIPFHQDGDPAGTTPFETAVLPGALRILVPDTTPAGLFSRPGEPFI